MPSGIFNTRQQPKILTRREWQPQQKSNYVECLVVGGGAGGGNSAGLGAGGGAGGVIQTYTPIVNGSAITVTVGGGGSANANGSNSVFGNVTAIGGGTINATGGSGGGSISQGLVTGGRYGQGFGGGPSGTSGGAGEDPGGGGGGAGCPGSQGSADNVAGSGGVGVGSWLSGTSTVYGGGGGGSLQNSTYGGRGAWGGGGNGIGFNSASPSTPAAAAGTANTGGGGGGGSTSAAGGSGIVVVRYPANFAAPVATTGSPAVTTTGVGSMSFNGVTQRFQYTNNAAFQFGTGSFCVDAWVYPTALSGYRVFAKCSGDSAWLDGWSFVTNGSGIDLWINGSQIATTSGSGLTLNTWQHVAAVRNGTAVTLYINGVSVATATNSTNIVPTAPLTIAAETSTASIYAGLITSLRIVKGAAVYTSNFTPSLYPAAPVSGTSLLLTAPSISYNRDFSGNNFVPSSVTGPPTWSSSIPFTDLSIQNRVYSWTSSGSITF